MEKQKWPVSGMSGMSERHGQTFRLHGDLKLQGQAMIGKHSFQPDEAA